MTLIKICGVTRPEDAAQSVAAGADFIGLNFWPRSKRFLALDRAPEVAAAARGAKVVGVFVNAALDDIVAHARTLDAIQLHGDETGDVLFAVAAATALPVWKAIPADDLADLGRWRAEVLLLDTPSAQRGGTGRTFDWSLARAAVDAHPGVRIVLAGGLDPNNVAAAVAEVRPHAVDVASGVESAPGIKDPAKVAAFVAAVRNR